MKSTVVGVRLRPEEAEMLEVVRKSAGGNRNASELLRLLLLREYRRRTAGRSVVEPREYVSDVRSGRPRRTASAKELLNTLPMAGGASSPSPEPPATIERQ